MSDDHASQPIARPTRSCAPLCARPLIGVSSYARSGQPPTFSIPVGYIDGVRGAGGTPLVLPPGEPDPEALLAAIDGLIVSGGGDIAPEAYGGQLHETVYSVCEERDRFEFALVRHALARPALPLLCICRGLQLLNVNCGGSLHVHIPERYGDAVAHRLPPRLPTRHPIRVDPDSLLAQILGTTRLEACSFHHQGIDRLGAGLRPVAWADDGVIEAVEHEDHPWCIGVQWHPEMQLAEPAPPRLFEAMIARVRSAVA